MGHPATGAREAAKPRRIAGRPLLGAALALALSAVLGSGAAPSARAAGVTADEAMRLVGTAGAPATAVATTDDGHLLIAGVGARIGVYATGDPCTLLGWSPALPGLVSALVVSGDRVYVGLTDHTIRTMQISDSRHPVLLGTHELADQGTAYDMAASPDVLAVGTTVDPGGPDRQILEAVDVASGTSSATSTRTTATPRAWATSPSVFRYASAESPATLRRSPPSWTHSVDPGDRRRPTEV
jgi:hypothetical protein